MQHVFEDDFKRWCKISWIIIIATGDIGMFPLNFSTFLSSSHFTYQILDQKSTTTLRIFICFFFKVSFLNLILKYEFVSGEQSAIDETMRIQPQIREEW